MSEFRRRMNLVIYTMTLGLLLAASEGVMSKEPVDTSGKVIVGQTTGQVRSRLGASAHIKSWKIGKESKLVFEGIHSPECAALKEGETLELWAYPIEGGYKQIVFMSGRVLCSRWGNFKNPFDDLLLNP